MAQSRYRNVDVDEEKFYLTSDFPDQDALDAVPTFQLRVSKFDRLDQLAFKYLGAGEYWWIIALINDIDWVYNFEDGTILRIPVNAKDVLRLI